MSDDEDYMSDKFLQGMEKSESSSLLYRHCDKRQHEIMKKKAEIEARLREKKSVATIEQTKREEGLSSAITSDNKGFGMLMKMGYKPGQAIGKTQSGIVEPISVDVKADRAGLGKVKEKKRQSTKAVEKLTNANMKDFRNRIAQKKSEQLLKLDLLKSQKVCEQLDAKLNIQEPIESWFWTPKPKSDDEESDSEDESEEKDPDADTDEDSLDLTEKLEFLTKYLRKKHFYCVWCGITYNDEDDLKDNCPGDTRDEH